MHRPMLLLVQALALSTPVLAEELVPVADAPLAAVSAALIDDVMAHQPAGPVGVGRPIGDRAYWTDPRQVALAKPFVEQAEKLLTATFPTWSDEDYLDFSKTGTRPRGERMLAARDSWLKPLVLAECVENQGRFLPALSTALAGYLDQPSWVLPAHDVDLRVFERKHLYVDLNCAVFGADLAEALYLVGERLDPALNDRLAQEIRRRLVDPVRESFRTGKGHYWLTVRNNWNAVCLAGSTSAALIVLADPKARAEFMACADYSARNSFLGYRADGYNDEGGGYHNYGFSNLFTLRERLRDGSGGRLDLFRNPLAAKVARFAMDYRMTGDLMPTFADSRVDTKVNPDLVAALRQVFRETPPDPSVRFGIRLHNLLQVPTPLAADEITPVPAAAELRSYWESVGVLVARPRSETPCHLSVAIKNGGNSNHSHNDVGSWCLAIDDQMLGGDPGGPFAYYADTFGPERYTKYKMLGSYGHPLPVIDGTCQRDATTVQARVLSTKFTDDEDRYVLDATAAYNVPALIRFERTLTYDRRGLGQVRIDDVVTAASPIPLEMGFVCRGTITYPAPDRLVIEQKGRRLEVVLEGPAWFRSVDTVEEMAAPPFHRLGFRLKERATKVRFAFVMRPLAASQIPASP